MRAVRLKRIVIALALGAATTVLIAWLAMFLPRGNAWHGPRTRADLGVWAAEDRNLWQMSRGENAWHTVVSYSWMQMSGMSIMIPREDYQARKFDFRTLPAPLRPRSLGDLNMQAWCHETGWPMRALSCRVGWERQVANSDIIYRVVGGLQLPRDAKFNPRALPLVPVWPGSAVDAASFGGVWLVALTTRAMGRRAWRRRRGRCGACGYSRAGLKNGEECPECGCLEVGGARGILARGSGPGSGAPAQRNRA